MIIVSSSGMLTITDFINILRHHYKSPIVSYYSFTIKLVCVYARVLCECVCVCVCVCVCTCACICMHMHACVYSLCVFVYV